MLFSWKSFSHNYEHNNKNNKTLFCPHKKVLHVLMLFQIDSSSFFCLKFCWANLKMAGLRAAWYNCTCNGFFCKYKHAAKSHVIDFREKNNSTSYILKDDTCTESHDTSFILILLQKRMYISFKFVEVDP